MRKLVWVLVAIVAAISITIVAQQSKTPPKVQTSETFTSAQIFYPSEYNFRQSINDCGPFNVAAVIRALTKENVSSKNFAENIKWRLPNKYTIPIGLEEQLTENGITIEVPNLKPLSQKEKLQYLKETLIAQKPIILLGEQEGYQHYLTLFGFKNDDFYIYDSLHEKGQAGLTKDENGDLPGNRNLSSEELIKFWEKGGMYGLYEWYAIVASSTPH